jgi:hypothetical protein
MKKQVLSIIALSGLLFTLMAGNVSATSTIRLRATIPFEFSVGDRTLPAGQYTVERINPYVLLIRSEDCHSSVLSLANGVQARVSSETGKLVFHRYGSRYFLSQVWSGGSNNGYELPRSRAEQELRKSEKHLAGNTLKPEITIIQAE